MPSMRGDGAEVEQGEIWLDLAPDVRLRVGGWAAEAAATD